MDERKNKNVKLKITLAAIFVTLAIIAEIYVALKVTFYPYVFAIVLAVLAVVAMYVLVSGALQYFDLRNKQKDELFEDTIKAQKASYILHKKYFETLEERMNVLEKAAVLPTEEIVTAQKGIAKVIISRSRENTEATLSSHEQIIEMLGEFEKQLNQSKAGIVEQLHEDNVEIVEQLRENNAGIVEKLNENSAGLAEKEKAMNAESIQQMINKQQEIIMNLKDMEIRMSNAILQSQKVITEQIPVYQAPVMQSAMPVMQSTVPVMQNAVPTEQPAAPISQPAPEPVVMEEPIIEKPVMMEEPIIEEPVVMEEPIIEEPVMMEEPIIEEPVMMEEPAEELPPMPDLSDPNKQMSPDDIAALFANLGGGSPAAEESVPVEEIIPDPVVMEEPIIEEPVMMEEPIIEEPVMIEEPIIEEPVMMEEPIIAEEPAEELPPMPDLSDPNKQMSPDDIAALFANLGGRNSTPVEEPTVMEEPILSEEPAIEEPVIEEPVIEGPVEEKPPMPDLSDPNKKMSPEEIAALFANLS